MALFYTFANHFYAWPSRSEPDSYISFCVRPLTTPRSLGKALDTRETLSEMSMHHISIRMKTL